MERDTLQEYFESGEAAGVIDYALRIVRAPNGQLDFYIHPQDKNGETADFTVNGGFVNRLTVGAGSSRPTMTPLVGS